MFNWLDYDGSSTQRTRPTIVGSFPSWWHLGPDCSYEVRAGGAGGLGGLVLLAGVGGPAEGVEQGRQLVPPRLLSSRIDTPLPAILFCACPLRLPAAHVAHVGVPPAEGPGGGAGGAAHPRLYKGL
jgi:hypothetical protein